MRIVLALVAVAVVALSALALARAPQDGAGGTELRRYDLRSRFAHRTLPQVAALRSHHRAYLRFYARELAGC